MNSASMCSHQKVDSCFDWCEEVRFVYEAKCNSNQNETGILYWKVRFWLPLVALLTTLAFDDGASLFSLFLKFSYGMRRIFNIVEMMKMEKKNQRCMNTEESDSICCSMTELLNSIKITQLFTRLSLPRNPRTPWSLNCLEIIRTSFKFRKFEVSFQDWFTKIEDNKKRGIA